MQVRFIHNPTNWLLHNVPVNLIQYSREPFLVLILVKKFIFVILRINYWNPIKLIPIYLFQHNSCGNKDTKAYS